MTSSPPKFYSQTQLETANSIYQFWIASSLAPAQAAGMLEQADAESSLDPGAVGDNDTAFGLYQWHEDRVAAIKAGCGIDVRTADALDQCKAALWELQNIEKAAFGKIQAAATAYDAGYAACLYYERAGAPGQPVKRGNGAQVWFDYLQAVA